MYVTGTKHILGDISEGTTDYNLGTHMHSGFDGCYHKDSYVYIEVYGLTNSSGLNPFIGNEYYGYSQKSVSGSYKGGFGWDMDIAGANSSYYCGYCGFVESINLEVDM